MSAAQGLPDDAPEDFRAAERDGALTREARPDHLTAGACVLDPSGTSVLLVLHKKVGMWLQPGGHVDPGESLADAALREAREETGVDALVLATPLPVDYDRHRAPCGARDHLDVRFAVVAPAGSATAVSDESDDVAWWPVDALPQPSSPDLPRLVAAAQQALASR